MNKAIKEILDRKVAWLADKGPDNDIAISTRIRLARNIEGYVFPINATEESLVEVIDTVNFATTKTTKLRESFKIRLKDLNPFERRILMERRLVSKEFIGNKRTSGITINKDETLSIMINEEDHLRIQALDSGLQLETIWEKLNKLDNELSQNIKFAYDNELGFLTSCPTNVGTGMRASVMLHLPALTLTNQVKPLLNGVRRLGYEVRGIFGEGTDSLGNLYQVSNQSTLGEREEDIVFKLNKIILKIIEHEKDARIYLLEKEQNLLLDTVGRSYGILRHAYLLNGIEATNSLSALRLGVDMGMFTAVELHLVNDLFVLIQAAHLQNFYGSSLNQKDRDIVRAELIRKKLKDLERTYKK